jgi:hypothetical protein
VIILPRGMCKRVLYDAREFGSMGFAVIHRQM